MSRPLPKEEYNKRLWNRAMNWILGKKDPYLGNMETIEKETEEQPNLHHLYREEEMEIIEHVQDTKHNKVYRSFFYIYRVGAVVCCITLIALLLYTVSFLPPVGDKNNPAHNEVVDKYIEDGLQDTGAVNFVTGMILDYRAFDTFGESNVLFIATCTVLILMRNYKRKKNEEDNLLVHDKQYEPKSDSILQKITFFLFPIIVIFGIYVILNGHISPGGGFSGGAIIGAALILYTNAYGFEKTERFFTEKTYKWISFSALAFYCLAKSYSFYTGAHHLESGIPLGTPGAIISSGLILPLNICVGMVVACTMYAFYALFKKGGL